MLSHGIYGYISPVHAESSSQTYIYNSTKLFTGTLLARSQPPCATLVYVFRKLPLALMLNFVMPSSAGVTSVTSFCQ